MNFNKWRTCEKKLVKSCTKLSTHLIIIVDGASDEVLEIEKNMRKQADEEIRRLWKRYQKKPKTTTEAPTTISPELIDEVYL